MQSTRVVARYIYAARIIHGFKVSVSYKMDLFRLEYAFLVFLSISHLQLRLDSKISLAKPNLSLSRLQHRSRKQCRPRHSMTKLALGIIYFASLMLKSLRDTTFQL